MKRSSVIYHKINLTWNAKPGIFRNAKELRKSMTEAESILWEHLRNNKLNGLKFRRQHYIADFYCHQKKLVIEIDRGIHDNAEQEEYDKGRTCELEDIGFKVLRLRN